MIEVKKKKKKKKKKKRKKETEEDQGWKEGRKQSKIYQESYKRNF